MSKILNSLLIFCNSFTLLRFLTQVRSFSGCETLRKAKRLCSSQYVESAQEDTKLLPMLVNRSVTYVGELTPSLISAIAILRMEKLDWAIEKATELGADAITLFPAEHSEKKQLSENQVERLRNVSIAAMKQCGRLYLPSIAILPSLERVLELDAMALFGDTDPKAPMLEAIPDRSPILFITGPEKGFSTSEDALLKHRAKGVRLHINILRAETAPIVALSLLSRTLTEKQRNI